MWNVKLAINANPRLPMSVDDQIRLFHKIGFDGVFLLWSPNTDLKYYQALTQELGMQIQSVHAVFGRIHKLWQPFADTQEVLQEQLQCLRDSAAIGAPIVVCHAFIGFKDHTPTQFGIENFRVMVDEAKKLGIKIAFENTEGEEYLFALMEAFRDEPHEGFCWDTGHEMCYNHSQDLIAKYGDRLLCTHLNDNLGIRDFDGEITPRDDLHLLPFDGIADWDDIAARLRRCGYNDYLTFELKLPTTLSQCDMQIYGKLSVEEYFTQAYMRACRVAAKLSMQK